jgi:hypothetical protein
LSPKRQNFNTKAAIPFDTKAAIPFDLRALFKVREEFIGLIILMVVKVMC